MYSLQLIFAEQNHQVIKKIEKKRKKKNTKLRERENRIPTHDQTKQKPCDSLNRI